MAKRKNSAAIAKVVMQKSPPTEKEEEEKGETIAKSTDIPLCIIEEILLRSSVEDLLKWKCVSKPWNDLISSPEFARVHRPKDTSMAIMDYCCRNYDSPHPTADDRRPPAGFNKIYYLPKILPRGTMEIVGSCDGLICLTNRVNMKIAFFNPSTRDIYHLQTTQSLCSDWFHSWFGHHPKTGDYTMFLGGTYSSYRVSFVTRVTQYWDQDGNFIESNGPYISRSIDHKYHQQHRRNYNPNVEIGTLLHGTLHWPACAGRYGPDRGRYKIVTYDFNEELAELAAPGGVAGDDSCFTLGVLDECLFAMFKFGDHFELWIMKEYGVGESWTKYRNVYGYSDFKVLTPLGFCGDGREMIVDADGSMLTKYNLRSDEKNMGTVVNIHRCKGSKAIIFSESLVCFERSMREVRVSLRKIITGRKVWVPTKKDIEMFRPENHDIYPQNNKRWMLGRNNRKVSKNSKKESAGKKIKKVSVYRLERIEEEETHSI